MPLVSRNALSSASAAGEGVSTSCRSATSKMKHALSTVPTSTCEIVAHGEPMSMPRTLSESISAVGKRAARTASRSVSRLTITTVLSMKGRCERGRTARSSSVEKAEKGKTQDLKRG